MSDVDIEEILDLATVRLAETHPDVDASGSIPAKIPESIDVVMRKVGGVYVFTSASFPGLHHAHYDLRKAFETLPAVVSDLVRLQTGQAIEFTPDRSFEEMSAGMT